MTKVFNPQWHSDYDVDTALFDYMANHNFQPTHTGGGCMAWERVLEGESILITDGDLGLGEWKERAKRIWTLSRHNHDGMGQMSLLETLTLAQAVLGAGFIPPPPAGDQVHVETLRELMVAPRVAKKFVALLKRELTKEQWKEMLERNAKETHEGVCHSQDFLDANMVMAEALEACGVALWSDEGHMLDRTTDIWNRAWDLAMPELGRIPFEKEHK